jgi:hypothetical protein
MTNPVLEKIKAELAAFEEKKKAMLAEIQKEFPGMFVDLFKQAPKLKSFGWTQYTPYFNDGDTCEFSVHLDYPLINGSNEEYDDVDEDEISIKIYDYKKLETEEDVRINDEVAAKSRYHWYMGTKSIGSEGLCYNPKYDADAARVVEEIKSVLNDIPEEFFRDMFGDHVKVTLFADGEIEVDGCDHD